MLRKLDGREIQVGGGREESKRTTLRHWNQGCIRTNIEKRTSESSGEDGEKETARSK